MEFDQSNIYQNLLLNNIYSQRIQQNEEHIKTWMQYRDRHKKIIEGLKVLSQELSMNCIVPIGKRALMKGKLKHTSEILVCIGDGYFVKYTTQQAIALCNRRIKRSEEMLDQFEKERNLLEIRNILPLDQGAFETGDCKNVIEHWDEKKLEDWKVEHRKKEKEYRKQLLKLKDLEKQEIVTEDDLFKRLDELELEEELCDELHRFEEQNQFYYQDSQENKSDEESDDESEELLEEESDEQEKVVNLEQMSENNEDLKISKKNSLRPNEQSSNLNLQKLEIDQQQTARLETVNINEINKTVNIDEINKTVNIDEINKTVRINEVNKGVNIDEINKTVKFDTVNETIKIDDINNTITLSTENAEESSIKDTKINGKFEVSIIKEDEVEKTLGKQNYPAVFNHQKQKVKKNVRSYNEANFKESDNYSQKIKSSGRRVSFAEPNFIEVESTPYLEIIETCKEDLTNENDNDEMIKIVFTHSNTKLPISENNENLITNPGDIYRIFSKPKSILKKSPDVEHVSKNVFLVDDLKKDNTEIDCTPKSTYNIVVQDVQERKAEKIVKECNEPISKSKQSRFKLERANIKRAYK